MFRGNKFLLQTLLTNGFNIKQYIQLLCKIKSKPVLTTIRAYAKIVLKLGD